MNNPVLASFSILVFTIPAYYFLWRSLGAKTAIKIIAILNIFALGIETIALMTGFPYGEFSYSNSLGYKLFNVTPWSVGLSWSMIIIGAAAIGQRLNLTKGKLFLFIVFGMLVTDLVLDPGAVALGYWNYANSTGFYHVPYSNFAGWLLSGSIGTALFIWLLDDKKIQIKASFSLICILGFWTAVSIFLQLYIPAIIGVILLSLSIITVSGWVFSKG